jgi:hypothetical protein
MLQMVRLAQRPSPANARVRRGRCAAQSAPLAPSLRDGRHAKRNGFSVSEFYGRRSAVKIPNARQFS